MQDVFGRYIPDNHRIIFSRATLAESLWEYGEEPLARLAMTLTEDELLAVQRVTLWHDLNDPEPKTGPRLSHGRIMARGAIEFFEGAARDTKRTRRRTRPDDQRYTADKPAIGTPAEHGFYDTPGPPSGA